MPKRMYSTVKWFNNRKGFGFLYNPENPGDDDDSNDIAIHYSEIEKVYPGERVSLNEGDKVSFVLTEHENGLRAVDAQRE